VLVGIAFSERTGNKPQWFLGLPSMNFLEAILLCQTGPNSITVIHVTADLWEIFQKRIGVGKKRSQLKINLYRRLGKWLINLPQPFGAVDITPLVQAQELVCIKP
jgi:hypothetical protein